MITKNDVKSFLNDVGIRIVRENSKGINIRCNICGDSKKSLSKARGWFLFTDDGNVIYYCHNEGESLSFRNYLKDFFPSQYKRFFGFDPNQVKSKLSADSKISKEIKSEIESIYDISEIYKSVSVPITNYMGDSLIVKNKLKDVYKYLTNRRICDTIIDKLYFGVAKKKNSKYDLRGRIIIPFIENKTDKVYAFQARKIFKVAGPKYITIKETNPIKIYNYYNVNIVDPVIITEGPIDSFFIDNAISTAGTISTNSRVLEFIKEKFPYRIWVFDNDDAGTQRTKNFYEAGESVSFWQTDFMDCKDINDIAVKYNKDKEEITDIILTNVIDNNFKSEFKLNVFLKGGKSWKR